MKLQKLKKLCVKNSGITIFESSECMWLGDGSAMYPIYDIPKLTDEQVYAVFDIPSEKRSSVEIVRVKMPQGYNFGDTDASESMLEPAPLTISCYGYELLPYSTVQGQAVFISREHLKPVDDPGLSLFVRRSSNGGKYIAIKRGIILVGVILSPPVPMEDIYLRLKALANACYSSKVEEIDTTKWKQVAE